MTFGEWWSKHGAGVALAALLIVGTTGFYKVEVNAYDGCMSGNSVRAALRGAEREQIEQTEAIKPSLFPDIPLEEFETLTDESVEQSEARIRNRFGDRECGSVWPLRP
jgi:hypothetical protein